MVDCTTNSFGSVHQQGVERYFELPLRGHELEVFGSGFSRTETRELMIAASLEALSRPGDVEDLDQESEVGLVQDWIDGLINEVKSSTRPFPKVVRKWDLGVPQAKPAAAIYKPNSLD